MNPALPFDSYQPISVGEVARLCRLHPRTVQRIWQRLGVPPDGVTAQGTRCWSRRQFSKLIRRWRKG